MSNIGLEGANAVAALPEPLSSDEYVEMHAVCTEDRIAVLPQQGPGRRLENPVTLLTGIYPDGEPWPGRAVQRPCVSILVGQYGVGKTTLMDRVRSHLTRFRADSKPMLVPLIRCGRCVSEGMSPQRFLDFLFGASGAPTLEQIHRGERILLLDGLDEIATGQREHEAFFKNLMSLLSAGAEAGPPAYNVVVSMRQEYLTSVTRDDAEDLTALIKEHAAGRPRVYYLSLDWMEPGQARSFLARRVPRGETLWDSLSRTHALREMLLRPLLMRLFCELLERHPELKDEVLTYRDPGDLLQRFVEEADRDQLLVDRQQEIARYRWDRELIAQKSLQLYREGRSVMTLADLRDIVVAFDAAAAERPEDIAEEDALKGIHKCPFLLLENAPDIVFDEEAGVERLVPPSPPVVRFSHAIFFEYFTALGMVPRGETDFTAFDELVLNIDMRKFLRGMMRKKEWYERTRKSYALVGEENKGEWQVDLHADGWLNRLDRVRKTLGDLITDPDREIRLRGRRLEVCIDWLLDQQHRFHPRYLIHNFEAIAVYARMRPLTDKRRAVTRCFSQLLEQRLREIAGREIDVRRAEHLLVERMLDVGQRLRLDWARVYAGAEGQELLSRLPDDGTRSRVASIIENIRSTLWL
jgi:hypothetical protein